MHQAGELYLTIGPTSALKETAHLIPRIVLFVFRIVDLFAPLEVLQFSNLANKHPCLLKVLDIQNYNVLCYPHGFTLTFSYDPLDSARANLISSHKKRTCGNLGADACIVPCQSFGKFEKVDIG